MTFAMPLFNELMLLIETMKVSMETLEADNLFLKNELVKRDTEILALRSTVGTFNYVPQDSLFPLSPMPNRFDVLDGNNDKDNGVFLVRKSKRKPKQKKKFVGDPTAGNMFECSPEAPKERVACTATITDIRLPAVSSQQSAPVTPKELVACTATETDIHLTAVLTHQSPPEAPEELVTCPANIADIHLPTVSTQQCSPGVSGSCVKESGNESAAVGQVPLYRKKLFIVADSQGRGLSYPMCKVFNNCEYDICVFSRPGARFSDVIHLAYSVVMQNNLGKDDFIVLLGGSNDVLLDLSYGKEFSRLCSDLAKMSSATNVIVSEVPMRFDLGERGVVQVKRFNFGLNDFLRNSQARVVSQIGSTRRCIGRKGLHYSEFGKYWLAKRIRDMVLNTHFLEI